MHGGGRDGDVEFFFFMLAVCVVRLRPEQSGVLIGSADCQRCESHKPPPGPSGRFRGDLGTGARRRSGRHPVVGGGAGAAELGLEGASRRADLSARTAVSCVVSG